MKKKIIIIVVVVALLILLIPIPLYLNDGGTVEYKALVYKISKVHRLTGNLEKEYEDGIIIEVLGMQIFSNVNKEDDIVQKDKNINSNIAISVKENTLTNEGMTILIKNNTKQRYYYGPEYYLEKYENGEYKAIEPKEILSWNAVLYPLEVNEEKEEVINWNIGYNKLSKGKYRLVRYFTAETNIISSANVSEEFFVEFEIK